MIQDNELQQAVSRILQRAERQSEISKIIETYVDVGVLAQLDNKNNQIMYGRRGTGKTHIFRFLGNNLSQYKNVVCYIDARTLGSSSQFSDNTIPLPTRCIALFRDILTEIHNSILEFTMSAEPANANDVWDKLTELSKILVETKITHRQDSLKETMQDSNTNSSIAHLGTGQERLKAGIEIQGNRSKSSETVSTYKTITEDKIIFPELRENFRDTLKLLNSTLYVLLDEWSSLPLDIQPYLAEFLKRSFLPEPAIVVKIASLEYRSAFLNESLTIGFEVGSDMSTALDIDDYYVYDRNPAKITETFADILFKHLSSELPDKYFEKNGIHNTVQFTSRLFTATKVFEEMVRAAEGVARDLISIFSIAFFDSQRKGRDSIEKASVLEAARQWYEKDKEKNLSLALRNVLERIVNEVIGQKRARSFLISRSLEKHNVIQQLFDYRILHLMRRGYADKESPGVRYNVYTLDYGPYVDLINTTKQPDIEMDLTETPAKDFIVPFDDKRSIRRIVIKEDFLNT